MRHGLPDGYAGYIGYIDLPTMAVNGSSLYAQISQINKVIELDASGNCYGYLVTTGDDWADEGNTKCCSITLADY